MTRICGDLGQILELSASARLLISVTVLNLLKGRVTRVNNRLLCTCTVCCLLYLALFILVGSKFCHFF